MVQRDHIAPYKTTFVKSRYKRNKKTNFMTIALCTDYRGGVWGLGFFHFPRSSVKIQKLGSTWPEPFSKASPISVRIVT
jgi:hypothetical protein